MRNMTDLLESKMRKTVYSLIPFMVLLFTSSTLLAGGAGAGGLKSDFTQLHLTLNADSITSNQDLSSLEPGLYEFNVVNKTSEKLEFIIQDLKTEKVLGKIKIRPNKVKKSRVKITENGFKYQKSNDIWHEFAVN